MIHLAKRSTLVSGAAALIWSAVLTAEPGCNRVQELPNSAVPHLFAYSRDELLAFHRRVGTREGHYDKVRRNSVGTRLDLYDRYGSARTRVVSISLAGEIKEMVSPGGFGYLGDGGQFVAWFDDIKVRIEFANGRHRKPTLHDGFGPRFDMDPSGRFFVEAGSGKAEIFSVEDPAQPIGVVDAVVHVDRIFAKGDEIYLFSRSYQGMRPKGEDRQDAVVCHILKPLDSRLEIERIVRIPRPTPRTSPFGVVDLDPWSDNVLLAELRDVPFDFLSSWFLFDLKAGMTTRLGRAQFLGIFLEKDILRSAGRSTDQAAPPSR